MVPQKGLNLKINKDFFKKKTFIIIAAVVIFLAICAPLLYAYYVNAPNFLSPDKNFISVSKDKASPGDTLNYTITITNEGRRAASDILVAAQIPENTTLAAGNIKYLMEKTSGKIYFFIGSLKPGKDLTLEYPVKIDIPLGDGSIISNDFFEIEYNKKGGQKINKKFKASLNTQIESSTDFSSSYFRVNDENGGLMAENDIVNVTLFIKNTGNMAPENIIIENIIPEGASLVKGSFKAKNAYMDKHSSGMVIKLEDVGLEKNIFLNYSLLNSGIGNLDFSPAITNGKNRIMLREEEPGRGNAELSEFRLTGSDENGGDLLPNETIRYDISLKNGGDKNFKYATLENTIPPHTSLIETSIEAYDINWEIEDEVFRVDMLELGPGEEFSFYYRVKVDGDIKYGAKIKNKAAFISNGDRLSTNAVTYNVISDYSYDIIALGDSQIRQTGWVEYLESIFEENYFYGNFNFINAGQNGETIDLGYNRMIDSGILRRNPSIFIINYGTNDTFSGSGYFRTSPEIFRHYLAEMVEAVSKNTGALVVIMSTGPVNQDIHPYHKNSNLSIYNNIAEQVANEHDAVFVDVFSPMIISEDYKKYLGDGLHYNSSGDELVAKIAFEKISEHLNKYGMKY